MRVLEFARCLHVLAPIEEEKRGWEEDIEATHCSRMVSDSNLTGDEIKAFLTNLCLKNKGKDL